MCVYVSYLSVDEDSGGKFEGGWWREVEGTTGGFWGQATGVWWARQGDGDGTHVYGFHPFLEQSLRQNCT